MNQQLTRGCLPREMLVEIEFVLRVHQIPHWPISRFGGFRTRTNQGEQIVGVKVETQHSWMTQTYHPLSLLGDTTN